MRREQLEHIIRAACGITGAPAVVTVVIVGSQAVLGQFPDAPEELLFSIGRTYLHFAIRLTPI